MIKTTLKNVMEAQAAIEALMSVRSLPSKVSYAVSKLAKACQSEMQQYEEARKAIFEKHGCVMGFVIDPQTDAPRLVNGMPVQEWQHPEDDAYKSKVMAAVKEGTELLDVEIEINALYLYLDKFVDRNDRDLELPGNAFFGLDWAIKEKSE